MDESSSNARRIFAIQPNGKKSTINQIDTEQLFREVTLREWRDNVGYALNVARVPCATRDTRPNSPHDDLIWTLLSDTSQGWGMMCAPLCPTRQMPEKRNQLGQESSPYLLQHADNPVAWHSWNDEALDRARAEDKPILLSIGYSACHWCHVMAHESFEDEATAALMNQYFVNIKVDREERPDLDKIYQLAHQVLTRRPGGWPLTMFLDPVTHLPFFGGTYFPKQARYQLPGFMDLLRRIANVFETQRESLREQGDKLTQVFEELTVTGEAEALPGQQVLIAAQDSLAQQYDPRHGGFGDAPKFPMPTAIGRILRHWAYGERRAERDRQGLDMAMTTLTQMARGGIYDHLGGGFCRYSTDRKWMIPHFEKMLYDNGPLLALYADALGVSRDELFASAVRETAQWVMREMQSPEGGYYAALDADSEGEEGKFYLWRRNEVKKLLTEDEYLVVETLYGLDKPANFEGRWNLHRYDSWRSVVSRLSLEREDADRLLASARKKLYDAREQRVRPGRDDKVLCAWNGLMILGMARASNRLGEPRWLESAQRAMDFIRENLWDGEQLRSSWTDGRPGHPAYLDDYANLLAALLALLEARWRDDDIRFAIAIADAAIEKFRDVSNGGFYFTAHDQEHLIYRPKPTMDEAMPAGNGMIARSLNRLGHLMANARYLEVASETLRWAAESISRTPAGHCTLLDALEDELYPPQIAVIRGQDARIAEWLTACQQGYKPWRMCIAIPTDQDGAQRPPLLPPYLPRVQAAGDISDPVAYVCSGLECSLPIKDLDTLKATLS